MESAVSLALAKTLWAQQGPGARARGLPPVCAFERVDRRVLELVAPPPTADTRVVVAAVDAPEDVCAGTTVVPAGCMVLGGRAPMHVAVLSSSSVSAADDVLRVFADVRWSPDVAGVRVGTLLLLGADVARRTRGHEYHGSSGSSHHKAAEPVRGVAVGGGVPDTEGVPGVWWCALDRTARALRRVLAMDGSAEHRHRGTPVAGTSLWEDTGVPCVLCGRVRRVRCTACTPCGNTLLVRFSGGGGAAARTMDAPGLSRQHPPAVVWDGADAAAIGPAQGDLPPKVCAPAAWASDPAARVRRALMRIPADGDLAPQRTALLWVLGLEDRADDDRMPRIVDPLCALARQVLERCVWPLTAGQRIPVALDVAPVEALERLVGDAETDAEVPAEAAAAPRARIPTGGLHAACASLAARQVRDPGGAVARAARAALLAACAGRDPPPQLAMDVLLAELAAGGGGGVWAREHGIREGGGKEEEEALPRRHLLRVQEDGTLASAAAAAGACVVAVCLADGRTWAAGTVVAGAPPECVVSVRTREAMVLGDAAPVLCAWADAWGAAGASEPFVPPHRDVAHLHALGAREWRFEDVEWAVPLALRNSVRVRACADVAPLECADARLCELALRCRGDPDYVRLETLDGRPAAVAHGALSPWALHSLGMRAADTGAPLDVRDGWRFSPGVAMALGTPPPDEALLLQPAAHDPGALVLVRGVPRDDVRAGATCAPAAPALDTRRPLGCADVPPAAPEWVHVLTGLLQPGALRADMHLSSAGLVAAPEHPRAILFALLDTLDTAIAFALDDIQASAPAWRERPKNDRNAILWSELFRRVLPRVLATDPAFGAFADAFDDPLTHGAPACSRIVADIAVRVLAPHLDRDALAQCAHVLTRCDPQHPELLHATAGAKHPIRADAACMADLLHGPPFRFIADMAQAAAATNFVFLPHPAHPDLVCPMHAACRVTPALAVWEPILGGRAIPAPDPDQKTFLVLLADFAPDILLQWAEHLDESTASTSSSTSSALSDCPYDSSTDTCTDSGTDTDSEDM